MQAVRRMFHAETYEVEIRSQPNRIVQSASVSFPGLLHELGLSPHAEQKLTIKVEVDTNPPPHAVTETSVIRKHVLLNLLHYDKSSLFAGKLHAILSRPHEKGRDVYDLFWYLSDPLWPEPNLPLLEASLRRTGNARASEALHDWKKLVARRLESMNWSRVVADVRPFLERPQEIHLLTLENIRSLLEKRRSPRPLPQEAPARDPWGKE